MNEYEWMKNVPMNEKMTKESEKIGLRKSVTVK